MAKYIKREDAKKIIEEKQKELCPVGRYGRHYVYGSDREKYDAWEEIIDALENLPTADVAEVRHGRWLKRSDGTPYCSNCGANERDTYSAIVNECAFCYSCGARMDQED